jgi:hypothetical protein
MLRNDVDLPLSAANVWRLGVQSSLNAGTSYIPQTSVESSAIEMEMLMLLSSVHEVAPNSLKCHVR